MNGMKYIYIYILQLDESSIKEKVEPSYSESTLKETRKPIPKQQIF